jgi:predicted ATPase/transcriptional regulator with XRE-family HTH domain
MAVEGGSSFGTWLRARRKALDLTQFDLAERVGCAEATVQRIEVGERRPSKQVAALLAEALGVPAADRAQFLRFARQGSTAPPPADIADATMATGEQAFALRGDLPQSSGPLLGREADLAAAGVLLGDSSTRLLTLTGPPGTGKTRLAIALAGSHAHAYRHGACFVSLAALSDPALVPDTVARALGLQEDYAAPLAARLSLALRQRHLLLVLDNFEQVLAATPRVGEWLRDAPRLQVLVTSRAPLGLPGEQCFPVSPLALPAPDTRTPAELLLAPAIALFVDRAQAADPAFSINSGNAADVAQLCAWLEGLPLGIELAAARSARLGPGVVRAALPKRLALEARGASSVPARQQTMRAAIAWSYDLLSPAEQRLLARMAVFAGGAPWEALDAVGNAHCDLEGGTLSALEGLLEQSLVRRDAAADGSERFTMLELVREYAQERLEASGEATEVGRLHAEYFLALAERADASLHGPEQGAWLARLEREHDNFRTALAWAARQENRALQLQLAGALGWFWRLRGHWEEGDRQLKQALEHSPADPTAGRARALLARAFLAYIWEDNDTAARASEEALTIYRTLGDSRGDAQALFFLSLTVELPGDQERRQALLQESLALARAAGDRWGEAKALYGLGSAAWGRGDLAGAWKLLEESAALFRALGDPRETALTVHNLGQVLSRQGSFAAARVALAESLALWQELRDPWGVGVILHTQSQVARRQGDFAAAADFLRQTVDLAQEAGDQIRYAAALWGFGDLAYLRNDDDQARQYFAEALALYQRLGNEQATPMQIGLAWLALHQGALAEAEQRSAVALDARDQRSAVEALGVLAGVAAAHGLPARAACLLGALDALRSPRLDADHTWVDVDIPRLVETIRSSLSPEEFDRAWAAGKALSWAEARALARAEDKPAAESEPGTG